MAKKVYAIKEGFNSSTNEKIENKIVYTWAECLKYVKGVKGAKYKSFEDMDSANQFLIEGSKMLKKGVDSYPEDCLHIYVDGSYNVTTKKYSYGVVAVRNNIVEYIESNAACDSSRSNIRQIAGELEGSTRGVEYALRKGDKKVVILHDYEGVSHHATGYWERREQSSAEYYNRMNEMMGQGIEVIFVKVDSHTGDLFNELVDEKCKEKLGIQSDKTVEKWLTKNTINVISEEVKQEILSIAPNSEDNIIVIDSNNIKTNLSKTRIKNEDIIEESKADVFNDIICIYPTSPDKAKVLINKLKTKEKTEFILHLLHSKI